MLENYIRDVIDGKKTGLIASCVRSILTFLSFFFRLAVKIRNFGFDSKLLTIYRAPVPLVISVGNIVVGGTGKTPATILIAEEFISEFLVAVLSRGYRGGAEKLKIPMFLSQGSGPIHKASYCGDEPYLISENLPKAIVIVGKNRHVASKMAAKAGAHLILLDDGMQHRQVARDLEVVLMDIQDPFGGKHLLPRGYLREDLSGLSRAHLIILNHVENHQQFLQVKQELLQFTKASIVGCRLQVNQVEDLKGKSIASLRGKKVGLFCAIAKPQRFKETVISEGAHVLDEYFISDHLPFEPSKLEKFAISCKQKGIEMLLCTEKDSVKFADFLEVSLPVFNVKVKLKLIEGDIEWKTFIENAKKDILRRM